MALITLFFIAFFLNLLYELLHSLLYKTCQEASLKKYIYLILKAAIFDGLVISVISVATFSIFPAYQLVVFVLVSLAFAYLWEIYSLKAGKWEYAKTMPKMLGVGITPLVQLVLTGLLSLYIANNFFVY